MTEGGTRGHGAGSDRGNKGWQKGTRDRRWLTGQGDRLGGDSRERRTGDRDGRGDQGTGSGKGGKEIGGGGGTWMVTEGTVVDGGSIVGRDQRGWGGWP